MYKMNRREFLKGMFSAAVIAAIPASTLNPFLNKTTDIITIDGVIVDYTSKTITLDKSRKCYSVQEFYSAMMEVWDDDELLPIIRNASIDDVMLGG